MKKLLSLLFTIGLTHIIHAQNTNISGIVNTYQSVSTVGSNTISVNSTSGFNPGDLILLIQMQGVTIDETNSASFGDIVNYNSSGHYELLTVCSVPNSTDLMVSTIQRTYDPAGIVQVIRVPVYNDATVTSTLTADSWNGSTGGVLALKCNGDLILNDNIDVQGLGFNGATIINSGYSCSWFVNVSDYFYNISTGEGALKGEGNAIYITNKTAGRGAQANGGGGGNDHNSGGGGGGNGGAGGAGGDRIASGSFTCSGPNPGEGGKAQTYNTSENRIFLGGGGGAGHQNNAGTSLPGGNGGGIVFIIANRIIGNSQSILANGASAATSEDGASGGGAGGTVLLDANSYTGTVTADISGANGGDVGNVGTSNCNGPGGGGGGGVLWTSQSTTPANITLISNGGASGITASATQSNCTVGSANNAMDGAPGIEVNDLAIPNPIPAATGIDVITACEAYTWVDGNTYAIDTTGATYTFIGGASTGCDSTVTLDLTVNTVDTSVLALTDTLIYIGQHNVLNWYLGCGSNAVPIGTAQGDTLSVPNGNGQQYFAVISNNGCTDTTACYTLGTNNLAQQELSANILLYPNPASDIVNIDLGKLYQNVVIQITDLSGRTIRQWTFNELSQFQFESNLSKGAYLVIVETESKIALKRLIIE